MPNEPLSLLTDDGVSLEAELAVPPSGEILGGAVLAHPHPRQGGNMRSIVPGTLFVDLPAAGVAALRFNFRGVGDSEGTYGGGIEEKRDMAAAIEALGTVMGGRRPRAPLVLAGWSFGADVALAVGDHRVDGWFAAAPPLAVIDPDTMIAGRDPRPKLLAIPERDQFRPPDAAARIVARWPATTVEVVAGADHYFVGRVDRLGPLCLGLIRRLRVGGGEEQH